MNVHYFRVLKELARQLAESREGELFLIPFDLVVLEVVEHPALLHGFALGIFLLDRHVLPFQLLQGFQVGITHPNANNTKREILGVLEQIQAGFNVCDLTVCHDNKHHVVFFVRDLEVFG